MKSSAKFAAGVCAVLDVTNWIRATFLLCLLGALSTHAATYTWTGTGFNGDTDYKWSNPMNWAGLAAPQNGEQGVALVFPNSNAPRNTTNDVLNLVLSSVTFQGANYGIHGNGANGTTMTLLGAGGGNFSITASANGCQFGSTARLHLGSTGAVLVASGNLLTIKSRISGVYGFTKTGPGTLSLQGVQANTFFGPATVLAGILDFRGIGNALPGPLIIGDGNPAASPKARLYLDDQISDTSPVTVNANGSLELDGHDDMIGSLTLASGTVTTINGMLTGTLTLNGNVTNHVGLAGKASTISGKLSLGSTTRGFNVDADSELTIHAPITGATAGLTKSGPGQLTLTGSGNTYFGSTTVQSGILALVAAAKPGSVDNGTIVAQGARLLLINATVGNESLSLNGTTNAPVLCFTGTNSWAGPVMVAGDCSLDRFYMPDFVDEVMTFSGNISGTGAIRSIGWCELHFAGLGNNTFSGGYYCEEGLTYFEKTASASALGGPLFVGRAEDDFPAAIVTVRTLNQIPDTSLVTLRNSGALGIDDNATDTLGNVVFEGGWLDSMSGTFTLAGNVTNRLSPGNTATILGKLVLAAGQHVFDCEQLSALEVPGVLQGPGGVRKTGIISMLELYNTNTYAGLTEVLDGDLVLDHHGRPGLSGSGTVLYGSANLSLRGVGVTNETLTLIPVAGSSPIVWVLHTNVWKGPVVLNTDSDIRAAIHGHLILDGPISGPGSLVYKGDPWDTDDGTLVLQGSTDNTYQGETRILEGVLILNKNNATAIPGNLIIGHDTNGAPAASVYCQLGSQFAPVTLNNLSALRVTVNSSGGLHCGGSMQFIANLTTRGGSVFTEGGVIYLHNNWKAEPGSSQSYFNGNLRFASPYDNHTHLINIETNASIFLAGEIGQGVFVANVEKQGKGELAMIGSNSFGGNFTISDGRVLASGPQPFGTEVGRTLVGYGATLVTYSGTNAEPFTLSGHGYGNQGALVVNGSNYFNGAITLAYDTDIVTPGATNLAVFAGAISGPGGFTKLGEGTLRLAGSSDNTYTGTTKAKEGALDLTKTNALAVRGALEIGVGGGDARVRYLRSAQISDLSPVYIGGSGQFRLLGYSDTIGSLAGFGLVELLDGALFTGNDNTETTYGGIINGLGGTLTKTGTNTFTLTGNNTYTGDTFVKGGTLLVRGQQPQSDVTIQTGGTLAGNGAVGVISDLSGHVKPGVNTYGTLKCAGFLTHNPANQFQIEINGATPGVNCDQLDVAGPVTLMGGTLQLAMNYSGAVRNQYVIIRNDGSDAVSGTFAGLPQNGMITNNGVVFQIDYQGGDGNDVVLIQKSIGAGPQLSDVQKLGNGSIKIGGTGQPNATYAVEATDSLSAPIQWTNIGSVTANAQGQFSFTHPDAPQHPVRFYRFVVQ